MFFFWSVLYSKDQFIAFVTKKPMHDRNEALEYAKWPIIFGLAVTFVFVIGGLIWAMFAPLASAAHAHGVVISQVAKQAVQTRRE